MAVKQKPAGTAPANERRIPDAPPARSGTALPRAGASYRKRDGNLEEKGGTGGIHGRKVFLRAGEHHFKAGGPRAAENRARRTEGRSRRGLSPCRVLRAGAGEKEGRLRQRRTRLHAVFCRGLDLRFLYFAFCGLSSLLSFSRLRSGILILRVHEEGRDVGPPVRLLRYSRPAPAMPAGFLPALRSSR
jgi:hypothetical protein